MLVGPQSDPSSSRNLTISSECFSSNHYHIKYKWGGNVGPTTIYSPFFQTSTLSYRMLEPLFSDPFSAMGSKSHHLHIHIPRVFIWTWPRRRIFCMSHSSTHSHVQNYQITTIFSLSSYIVHVRYLVFMCTGTFSSKQCNPFKYMYDTGM